MLSIAAGQRLSLLATREKNLRRFEFRLFLNKCWAPSLKILIQLVGGGLAICTF